MKLTCLPGRLSEALAVAAKVVPSKAYSPVLGNVLLEAHLDGGVRLTGTDTESRAWHTVPAKVDEAGAVTLPPARLSDFLSVVTDGEPLTISVTDTHRATLVCGRARIQVAGISADDYPPAPVLGGGVTDLTLPAETLSRLIGATAFAAAPDTSRPVLAGVLVRVADGVLTLVAADGFRLALATAPAQGAPDLSVIVTAKRLGEVGRPLAGTEGTVRLAVDERRSALLIESEVGTWAIGLIDGQFPDWNRIIPRDAPTAVTVSRAELVNACRLVRGIGPTASDATGRGSLARLTIGAGSMEVRAADTSGDQEADIALDATLERGEGLSVKFNSRYLGDAAAALDGDQVRLELSGERSPSVLTRADEADGVLQVIMPMVVPR